MANSNEFLSFPVAIKEEIVEIVEHVKEEIMNFETDTVEPVLLSLKEEPEVPENIIQFLNVDLNHSEQVYEEIKPEIKAEIDMKPEVDPLRMPQEPKIDHGKFPEGGNLPRSEIKFKDTSKLMPDKISKILYKCFCCKFKFIYSDLFTDHLRSHKNTSKLIYCSYCKKAFVNVNQLISHLEAHEKKGLPDESEKLYKCFGCDFKFINLSMLKEHLPVHKKPEVISCMECGKKFKNIYDLIFHMDAHRGKFQNIVPGVRAQLVEKNVQNNCTSVKEYLSEKCFKCNSSIGLEIFKTHVSECKFAFECQRCLDKIFFMDEKAFFIHMKLHKTQGDLECDECGSTFRLLEPFKNHLKSQHEGLNFYRCKKCFKEFKFIGSLVIHNAYEHYSNQNFCVDCGRDFGTVNELRKHQFDLHSKKNLVRWVYNKVPIPRRYKIPIEQRIVMYKNEKFNMCFGTAEDLKSHDVHDVGHVKKPVKTYGRKE